MVNDERLVTGGEVTEGETQPRSNWCVQPTALYVYLSLFHTGLLWKGDGAHFNREIQPGGDGGHWQLLGGSLYHHLPIKCARIIARVQSSIFLAIIVHNNGLILVGVL